MITNDVLEMLEHDMVSHGLLDQCLKTTDAGVETCETQLKDALRNLLATGKVEIGFARMTRPDYVEFVGWKGSNEDRVSRAWEAVTNANGPDKEFAYWLCLRENVDRFEGNDE